MDLVSNKVSITAPRTIISDFKKVLSKIDVPKTQVSVSVTVLEISKDLIKQRSPASFVLEIPKNLSSINWEGMELDISDTPFTISADIFNWLSMNMKILEENNLAKVHSNPQLLLMNGQQASLFVGETRTMLVSGEVLTSTTVNVGVSVNMLARIYPDFVELILTPEVSHFADSGSTFFSVYRNQISSTVRVPYGETAVVGGITVKRSSDNTTKIPIIGEIPLVRYLFTGTKNSSTERELLILITPSKQEG
jgi:type II secretory pathway component GspD/PulD (secretin)